MMRKNFNTRREELLLRKRQLEARLLTLDAKQKTLNRKRDTRRKILVGAVAISYGEVDPRFRVALRRALRKAIIRDADKTMLADLLGDVEFKNSNHDEHPSGALPPNPRPI
jgi:hypothetical protein